MANRPCVLCVDDLPDHLQIRVELLKRFGCNAVTANDHQSALRIASEIDIDLSITDYHLKNGETGEDVARDLRALLPQLPVILLTGDPDIPESARQAVDAVLIKGEVDASTFFGVIKALLPAIVHHPRRCLLVRTVRKKSALRRAF
jgi:CheY-like chemotaxis protein